MSAPPVFKIGKLYHSYRPPAWLGFQAEDIIRPAGDRLRRFEAGPGLSETGPVETT